MLAEQIQSSNHEVRNQRDQRGSRTGSKPAILGFSQPAHSNPPPVQEPCRGRRDRSRGIADRHRAPGIPNLRPADRQRIVQRVRAVREVGPGGHLGRKGHPQGAGGNRLEREAPGRVVCHRPPRIRGPLRRTPGSTSRRGVKIVRTGDGALRPARVHQSRPPYRRAGRRRRRGRRPGRVRGGHLCPRSALADGANDPAGPGR